MFNQTLPKDPNLLLSMVNMKLRNDYKHPEDLARAFHIDLKSLINQLALHGYVYSKETNQFIHKES